MCNLQTKQFKSKLNEYRELIEYDIQSKQKYVNKQFNERLNELFYCKIYIAKY